MSQINQPHTDHSIQYLRMFLVGTAVLVLGTSCLVALYWIAHHNDPSQPMMPQDVVIAVGTLLAGVTIAAGMIAASAVVGILGTLVAQARRSEIDDVRPALERLEQSLRMLNSLQGKAIAGNAESEAMPHDQRPLALLDHLCDYTLMSDEQRQRCAERHWARRKQMHLVAIEREVLVGDWLTAFARLEELEIVMPADPQIKEMRERVESEQNARLDEELRVARGRLRQLMGAAMWQQAEEVVAVLEAKYPGKAEAQRLSEDLRREREAFERESMERLFNDIAAATERKQWRQAILAVDEFIRRFPLDERAERLRLDLPTLQENAAAQERKEQEEHFKDLLKRQRYDEAILTAKAVIAKYPTSPTAVELNKLLPKVEELAKQETLRAANNQTLAATVGAAAAAG